MSSENKADLAAGLALLALGAATIVGGLAMDRLEARNIHPASIPGLVPTALGIALVAAAGALTLRALARLRRENAGAEGRGELSWRGLGIALLLTVGYAVGLVGRIPYELATGLFVFLFIAVFEWQPGALPRRRLIRLGTALLQAVLVAWIVSTVFETVFLVRLP
jgi:hypothetical protein